MRKSMMWLLAGLSLAAGASAFVPQLHGGEFATNRVRVSCAAAGGAPRVAAPGVQLQRLRARQKSVVKMDTERTELTVVQNSDQWKELAANAAESGSVLIVMFKKEFCRKCAAMKPKFAKLARQHAHQDIVWAEVDGVKLGKDLRKELKLEKVPSFQVWGQGRTLEHFDADLDLTKTVSVLEDMVAKYSSDSPREPADKIHLMDLNRAAGGTKSIVSM